MPDPRTTSGSGGAPPTAPAASSILSHQFDTQTGAEKFAGAGGAAQFWIAPLDLDGFTPMLDSAVAFDLLPARNSFFDRQGQRVPDVGAGLDLQTTFNLAKLRIPGGRPVYQQMGVDEETIEMVGAFVGFDVDHYEETLHSTNLRKAGRKNAFYQARELLELINQGRPIAILMSTGEVSGNNNPVNTLRFINFKNESYRGFVRKCRVVYAHEQRVYWKLVVAITNRSDIGGLKYSMKVDTPESLLGQLPVDQEASSGSTDGSTDSKTVLPANNQRANNEKEIKDLQAQLDKVNQDINAKVAERDQPSGRRDMGNETQAIQAEIDRLITKRSGILARLNVLQAPGTGQ